MVAPSTALKRFTLSLLTTAIFISACAIPTAPTPTPKPPTATAFAIPASTSTPIPPTEVILPTINSVELDKPEVPNYDSIELTLSLDAQYTNPFDAREVRLEGLFTGPNDAQLRVPGFWDGDSAWRVRFTPWLPGDWQYQLVITDSRGESFPAEGQFNVTPSGLHGWLQTGNLVNPDYSGHYLAYHDGTPFYGLGHGDALNILADGFNIDTGVNLFDNMNAAGENYVVWWPLYSNSPIGGSYDQYSASNLNLIDTVVKDAQKKGVFIIFTIWDHPELRDNTHPWGNGNWERNGFSKLTSIDDFFKSDESWVWQENFYRYVIARWGYSPAIGMWQTVSEINGTNSYDNTDFWHERVNAYFIDNDPYRHPTTASRSGDVDWEEGHLAMDAPQVHIYALEGGAVQAADVIAGWTEIMWNRVEKPNWVGEFGITGNLSYPELFHNSIWAALGAGAALTPAEWNGGGSWGRMTPEMLDDLNRLGQFVSEIPLVQLNPEFLIITSSDPQVRGWGVAGNDGGLFWVQDFALEGAPIADVRADETIRTGVTLQLEGLAPGTYTLTPYNTWDGTYLDSFEVTCVANTACPIPLPDFKSDMAFKIEKPD
jgi:Domain of unknown function (DUF5060)